MCGGGCQRTFLYFFVKGVLGFRRPLRGDLCSFHVEDLEDPQDRVL